jgi:hypothetical protein
MSEEKGTCYFCEKSYKYVKDMLSEYEKGTLKYPEYERHTSIYPCQECGKSFCYYETPYLDDISDNQCGYVNPYYRLLKNKTILCKICFILKDGMKDEWLKINGKIYEALTGSNTKSANKN